MIRPVFGPRPVGPMVRPMLNPPPPQMAPPTNVGIGAPPMANVGQGMPTGPGISGIHPMSGNAVPVGIAPRFG